MAALGHSKTGPLVALGRQRELNEHRVPSHRFLPAGVVPAKRESSRWLDRLHDDPAALVAESHVAMSAGFDDEVHPVGEPPAHLFGLGDGSPHHFHRRLDQKLSLNHQAWHQYPIHPWPRPSPVAGVTPWPCISITAHSLLSNCNQQ